MPPRALPTVGACAVLTIDPVASLDPEIRGDSEAVAACERLVNKEYLVLVSKRRGLCDQWAPYNEYTVRFILQGEPISYLDRCIDSTMSIPIAPMTYNKHPSSREPLQPSNPLPWNDCYITGFDDAEVLGLTQFTELPIPCELDVKALQQHSRYLSADWNKYYDWRDTQREIASEIRTSTSGFASLPLGPDLSTTPIPVVPAGGPPTNDESAAAPANSESNNGAVEPGSGSEPVDVLFDNLLAHPPRPGKIVANFTHDLSTVKEPFTSQAEYRKEVEAIASISSAAWPRVARAKAQAIRRAVALAEAKAAVQAEAQLIREEFAEAFAEAEAKAEAKVQAKAHAQAVREAIAEAKRVDSQAYDDRVTTAFLALILRRRLRRRNALILNQTMIKWRMMLWFKLNI
ncbi:hypothetical protein C8R46DRAFT_1305091 [Mycena filopes]|nr:hypothetical protein C8R46DRAFT_1305091 [Mycena filopes]